MFVRGRGGIGIRARLRGVSGNGYTADEAGAFTVLDKVEEKRRGMGAIVCTCPQPNLLRENLLQLPVWYI